MPRTRCCDCTTPASGDFVNLTVSGDTELNTLTTTGLAELACLRVDTNLIYADCVNNFVGFLDSTPSYVVDVNGTFRAVGAGIFNSTLQVDNDFSVNTNVLFVDTALNRVGVNTAVPSVDFEVNGEAVIGSDLTVGAGGGVALFVDANDNRLGIQTLTPDAVIEIASTAANDIPMILLSGTQSVTDLTTHPFVNIVGIKGSNALVDVGMLVNTAWYNSSPLTTISQASILSNLTQGGSTLTNLNVLLLQPSTTGTYSGTITNSYGLHVSNASLVGGSTLTNQYGIYVDSISGAGTLNYALYTNSGLVRFGGNTEIVGSNLTVDTDLFFVDATNNRVYVGGTTATDALLNIQGTYTKANIVRIIPDWTTNVGSTGIVSIAGTSSVGHALVSSLRITTTFTPSVAATTNRGIHVVPVFAGAQSITTVSGIFASATLNTSAGTTTNIASVHVGAPLISAGSYTNRYGILVDAMTTSTDLAISTGATGYVNFGDRLGVGQASPTGKAHFNQSSTTAAIPSLHLEQDDISEEFVRFTGQAAAATLTQSLVPAAAVATFTVSGYLRINIQDEGNQIADGFYYMRFGTLA